MYIIYNNDRFEVNFCNITDNWSGVTIDFTPIYENTKNSIKDNTLYNFYAIDTTSYYGRGEGICLVSFLDKDFDEVKVLLVIPKQKLDPSNLVKQIKEILDNLDITLLLKRIKEINSAQKLISGKKDKNDFLYIEFNNIDYATEAAHIINDIEISHLLRNSNKYILICDKTNIDDTTLCRVNELSDTNFKILSNLQVYSILEKSIDKIIFKDNAISKLNMYRVF